MSKDKEVVEEGMRTSENKFLIEVLINEMRRLMKAKMEEVHEQIDKLENTHAELPQNSSNKRKQIWVTPVAIEHEQLEGDHMVDDREPFRNDRGYEEGKFRQGRN